MLTGPRCRPVARLPGFLALAFLSLMLAAQPSTLVAGTGNPVSPKPAAPNPFLGDIQAYDKLNRAGRHREALEVALSLVAGIRGTFGEGHVNVAEAEWFVAASRRGLGQYDEAMVAIRRSIATFDRVHGPDHPRTVEARRWAGTTLLAQGRFEEADAFLQSVAEAIERRFGAAHHSLGEVLIDRAQVRSGQHRIAEAEGLLLRALAIQEKALGPDHISLAYGLSNLGVLYRDAGRYAEAEPILRRSLDIRERNLKPDSPEIARSLDGIATVYTFAGRPAEAIPLLERALALVEAAYGPDHARVGNLLHDLALACKAAGQVPRAEQALRRALRIQEALLGPDHLDVAPRINALAVTLRALGRLDEAETLYRRALAIQERGLAPDDPALARPIGNIGNLLYARGRYAEAEPLHERALAIRLRALGPNHPDVADTLKNLALDRLGLGRIADALEASRTAARIVIERLAKASGLAMTGEIRNGRPNLEVNLRLLKRAQDDKLLDGKGGEEAFEVAQWMNQTAAAGAINRTAARLAGGGDALAALVREQQDLLAEREDLDARLLSALGKPVGTRDVVTERAMRARSASIEARLKELDARIAMEFPRYAGLITPKPVTHAEVASLIGADEALVMFHLGADAAYAYVVTHERSVWYRIDRGTADIEQRVRDLRAGLDPLTNPAEAKPFDPARAHALYRQILGSAEPVIRDKPHLLVVASGALTSLPFHVLVTDKPSKPVAETADFRDVAWLARRHAVTVLPTVASLKVARTLAQAPAPLPYLGIGDPTFTVPVQGPPPSQVPDGAPIRTASAAPRTDVASLSRALAPLPETADEVRAVGRLLGASAGSLLLRGEAREGRLKAMRLSDYRIIHFATHALVAGETALFSARAEPALALTLPGTSSEADDGLLMASEVAQLKLNADWILLSACNTASGSKPGAEALSGLAQAFFYAGARNLLVSHWPVGSEATVRLTTLAIQAIAGEPTMAPAEALRRGMIALMRDGDAGNAHPTFWAPFVMVGASGAARARPAPTAVR